MITKLRIEFQSEVVLFGAFIVADCIYPIWYCPPSVLGKLIVLNLILLLSAPFLFSRLFSTSLTLDYVRAEKKRSGLEIIPGVLISLVLLLSHYRFWYIPVETGDDTQSIIGPPAYFLGKLYALFDLGWLHWVALASFAGIVLVLILWKRTFNFRVLLGKKAKIILYLVTLIVLNIYGAILYHLHLIERVGSWKTIIRFPPVSKFLYLGGYLVFGINEIVPRGIQFLFLILTGVYIIKLMKLWYPKVPELSIFSTVLFFPPFFHFSNTGLLTCGVMFFFVAITYHLIKGILTEADIELFYFSFFLMTGLVYRRLVAGIFPAVGIYLFYLYFRKKIKRAEIVKYSKILILAILFAMPLYVSGVFTGIRDTAFVLRNILSLSSITAGITGFLRTNNLVLNIIVAISVFYYFLKLRRPLVIYWVLLTISYYIWISLSGGAMYYIRYFQPLYLVFIILFVILLTEGYNNRFVYGKEVSVILAILFCSVAFYQDLFESEPFQRRNLTNLSENIFPYPQVMEYFKEIPSGKIKVYAPCEGEPSHFYLAKYKLLKKVNWVMEPKADSKSELNSKFFYNVCKKNKIDYLFFPDFGFYKERKIYSSITDEPNFFSLEKEFMFKTNKAFLFKISK